jgi:hypothetical protein
MKNPQPGRVSVDLGDSRPKVEDICSRLGVQLSDFVRDAVNLHLGAELKREPQWRERALLYVLQAVDSLLRRTPNSVLARDKMMAVLGPRQKAEEDLALRVYGRPGSVGHGGGLEKTSRQPDPQLFPWEWPALELLIDSIDRKEPMYLPITGPNKGTLPRSAQQPAMARPKAKRPRQRVGPRIATRARRAALPGGESRLMENTPGV